MEISLKNGGFRIKGKTGILFTKEDGVLIESLDGATSKELLGAGEFEVSGISVIGIQIEDKEIVFVYEVDGLRICNLNNVTKKLADNKLSLIGDVDILLLPIGAENIERMQQVESYYVMPFGAKDEEELTKFLKESGLTVENMAKFTLKKEEIIEDSPTQIVCLEITK